MEEKSDDPPCCGRPAEPSRWKPAHHQPYFLILGNGYIECFRWSDTKFDEEAGGFGNCFRHRRYAEQARDKIKEVLANFHK